MALKATGTKVIVGRKPPKQRGVVVKQAGAIVSSIPKPPEVLPVGVGGMFIDTVSVIPKTSASLHLLPGKLDVGTKSEGEGKSDRVKVLIPFAEVRLGGNPIGEDDHNLEEHGNIDPPTVFEANLPLENLAFVLVDLANDLKRMCGEVADIGDGSLKVDPARMAVVRYFVAHLERQARQCRIKLDATYGTPQEPEEPRA